MQPPQAPNAPPLERGHREVTASRCILSLLRETTHWLCPWGRGILLLLFRVVTFILLLLYSIVFKVFFPQMAQKLCCLSSIQAFGRVLPGLCGHIASAALPCFLLDVTLPLLKVQVPVPPASKP